MKIFIDAGHGGQDGGACANGLREKDITLKISLMQKSLFEHFGHSVTITRTGDVTLSLDQRTNLENKGNYDVAISNHVNAGGGNGVEVWGSIVGGKSIEYSNRVATELGKLMYNRGVKTKKGDDGKDYFHMIRCTKAPAMIIEHGFIDTVSNADLLKQDSFVQKLADADVSGILGFDVRAKLNEEEEVRRKTEEERKRAEELARQQAEEAKKQSEVKTERIMAKDGKLFHVQVGAFKYKDGAESLVKELKDKGFNAFIKEE